MRFGNRSARALLDAFIASVNTEKVEEAQSMWHPDYGDKVRLYWRSLVDSHRNVKVASIETVSIGDERYVILADLDAGDGRNLVNRYGVIFVNRQAYLSPSQALLRERMTEDWFRTEGEYVVVASNRPIPAAGTDRWARIIRERLGLCNLRKSVYYLCGDSREVALLAGTRGLPGAITDGWTGDVMAYRIPDVHEVVHSVATVSNLGWPPPVLREGLAEYFDPEPYMADKLQAQNVIAIDELLVIEPDISRYPAFFPESRLFVGMVAEQYGLDSLLRLYGTLPYNEATIDSVAAVLGESPEVFRNRWNYVLHKAVSEEKRLVRRGKRVE